MLLVIDVGNTNITLGIFRGEELLGTFRMTTKLPRTSDEYGITLRELVERHGISSTEINAVIVASVVPDVMHSLGSAIIKYFGIKPMVVSAGIKTGISIQMENPRQVGSDRIVDAVAAYTLHGGPVIVIDFGTATTYDLVGPGGTFEAAVTAPGSAPPLRPCGARQPCFQPSRSARRNPSWPKIPSPACRPVWCSARWDRPSTSSRRSGRPPDTRTPKSSPAADWEDDRQRDEGHRCVRFPADAERTADYLREE